MPSIAFVTPLIRQAIATLESNLPGQIEAFNAEPDNTVTLAAPTEYVFGAMDPLVIAGPVIEVAATDGTFDRAGLGRTDVDHSPTLNVVVWHEGERGEIGPTYEMSLGLARCVIEVLSADGALGDAEIADEPGSIVWRAELLPDDLTEDSRDFRRWRVPVLIVLRLSTVERSA